MRVTGFRVVNYGRGGVAPGGTSQITVRSSFLVESMNVIRRSSLKALRPVVIAPRLRRIDSARFRPVPEITMKSCDAGSRSAASTMPLKFARPSGPVNSAIFLAFGAQSGSDAVSLVIFGHPAGNPWTSTLTVVFQLVEFLTSIFCVPCPDTIVPALIVHLYTGVMIRPRLSTLAIYVAVSPGFTIPDGPLTETIGHGLLRVCWPAAKNDTTNMNARTSATRILLIYTRRPVL